MLVGTGNDIERAADQDPHRAAMRPQQPRCDMEQRRLAAPGRADDGAELVRPSRQVGRLDGPVGAAAGERKHAAAVGLTRRAAFLSRVAQRASSAALGASTPLVGGKGLLPC